MIKSNFFYFNPLIYCPKKPYLTTDALSNVHFSILAHLSKQNFIVRHDQYRTKGPLLCCQTCNSLGIKHNCNPFFSYNYSALNRKKIMTFFYVCLSKEKIKSSNISKISLQQVRPMFSEIL